MSPSGVTGRVRVRAADKVADRRFHWEYEELPIERQAFRVTGGRPLNGRVRISGSKNAALKMLAAATLTGERCRFTNVPEIEDVRVMVEVLRDLGVVVDHPAPNTYEVAAGDVDWLFVPLEAAAKMRASFILLGPLLSRFGQVIMSNPGGDRIGRRPVNLHVDAMRALGADIEYRDGYYFARSAGRLARRPGRLPDGHGDGHRECHPGRQLWPMAKTIIHPAAQEPEVDDLILLLQKMGAEVERTAPDTVVVEGRRRLRGADHRVLPDRIEAGTFVVAAAVTGGDMTIEAAPCDYLGAFLETVSDIGVPVACGRDTIEVHCAGATRGSFQARDIATAPYPGLATDLQSPTTVLLSQASGTSRMHETIFEDRLEWLSELRKLGAEVELHDTHHASIHGPCALRGAEVEMGDLRAGASLILAALAAEGTQRHPRRAPRSPRV